MSRNLAGAGRAVAWLCCAGPARSEDIRSVVQAGNRAFIAAFLCGDSRRAHLGRARAGRVCSPARGPRVALAAPATGPAAQHRFVKPRDPRRPRLSPSPEPWRGARLVAGTLRACPQLLWVTERTEALRSRAAGSSSGTSSPTWSGASSAGSRSSDSTTAGRAHMRARSSARSKARSRDSRGSAAGS